MAAKILTRRKTLAAAAGGVALLVATPLVATAVASPEPPTVAAKGAALLDGGDTKFAKAADTPRPLASTAKIMVADVVLDSPGVDLERKVEVKQEYRDYVQEHGTSQADLQTGDKLTVNQLLYAALLPSGADAAFALADTFGDGDTTAARTKSFVSKMNAKADELGLDKTQFNSFDGSASDKSTPVDLAKLAEDAMQHDAFRTVVKSKTYKGDAPAANGRTRTYSWDNTNQLLGSYNGVVGIKTGTTTAAGSCLVFAATRDGKTLTGAILNSKDRYKDAAKMLDFGFDASTADDMKLRRLPADAERD
ncbi:serine hydrolase [Streptomyces sp. ODS28]|uniref:D-alanyl-D-alanine carboxypeptidase family protein n=1 Tax=Streptomyces sp. ODS28 TaxID=3136688 RepID=UPI0031EB5C1C